MSDPTNDRYAPPHAEAAHIHDSEAGAQPVKLFSAKGRIGRARLLAYSVYALLLWLLVLLVLKDFVNLRFGDTAGIASSASLERGWQWLAPIPFVVFCLLAVVRRLHDMNWSGWMVWAMVMATVVFVAMVPWLVPLALIWVFFVPGTAGPNRYGPPPPPNSLTVMIGACFLLPILFVIVVLIALLGQFAR